MTSPDDTIDSPMSLDSQFAPPTRKQWVEMAVAGLGSNKDDEQALQELQRTTLESIPLELLYTSAGNDFQTSPATDYSPTWDNRLCVNSNDASAANQQVREGLAGGITSIELHTPLAKDVGPALQGVQLDIAKVSLRAGLGYRSCAQELIQLAAGQAIQADQLQCEFNADPVGTYLQGMSDEANLPKELESMADFASHYAPLTPVAHTVLVDVSTHHNAGASTVEELHAACATAVVYLESMLDAGMSIDVACRQISFKLAMDTDVLLGVAKVRALKALWQLIVTMVDSQAQHVNVPHIVAETSLRCCSTLEPWNNHLRNLAAGTAALMGGADALIVRPHDVLLRNSDVTDTELGDRMARNIAIILERECGLRKVYDPMAGSYAIENLTQQLMEHVWQSLGATDTSEGWLDELTSGRWQTRLSNTHQQRIMLLNSEQRIAIGVNRYVQTDALNVQGVSTNSESRLKTVRDAEAFEQQALSGASA